MATQTKDKNIFTLHLVQFYENISTDLLKIFCVSDANPFRARLSPFWNTFKAKKTFSTKLKNAQFQCFSVLLFSPFGPFFLQLCKAILSYISLAISNCKPIWQHFFLIFLGCHLHRINKSTQKQAFLKD